MGAEKAAKEAAKAAGNGGGDEDAEEDEEEEDLLASVRRWLATADDRLAGQTDEEILSDFNLQVRFQGHVDTTPPDHLDAVLRALVMEHLLAEDVTAPKVQPNTFAKKIGPVIKKRAYIIE